MQNGQQIVTNSDNFLQNLIEEKHSPQTWTSMAENLKSLNEQAGSYPTPPLTFPPHLSSAYIASPMEMLPLLSPNQTKYLNLQIVPQNVFSEQDQAMVRKAQVLLEKSMICFPEGICNQSRSPSEYLDFLYPIPKLKQEQMSFQTYKK